MKLKKGRFETPTSYTNTYWVNPFILGQREIHEFLTNFSMAPLKHLHSGTYQVTRYSNFIDIDGFLNFCMYFLMSQNKSVHPVCTVMEDMLTLGKQQVFPLSQWMLHYFQMCQSHALVIHALH